MKKTYKISELCGCAWECAIKDVMNVLNKKSNKNFNFTDDREMVEDIAQTFEICFDENGNII